MVLCWTNLLCQSHLRFLVVLLPDSSAKSPVLLGQCWLLINSSFVAEIPMCIASIPIFNAEIFTFFAGGIAFLIFKILLFWWWNQIYLVVSKPFSKYACQNMWSSEFYGWKIRLETANQYHHWPTISSVHLPLMLGSPFGNMPRRQCCQATPGGSEDQQPPLRQRKVGYGWLSGGFTMTFLGEKYVSNHWIGYWTFRPKFTCWKWRSLGTTKTWIPIN